MIVWNSVEFIFTLIINRRLIILLESWEIPRILLILLEIKHKQFVCNNRLASCKCLYLLNKHNTSQRIQLCTKICSFPVEQINHCIFYDDVLLIFILQNILKNTWQDTTIWHNRICFNNVFATVHNRVWFLKHFDTNIRILVISNHPNLIFRKNFVIIIRVDINLIGFAQLVWQIIISFLLDQSWQIWNEKFANIDNWWI